VHASQDGPLLIDVGQSADIADLLTAETLGAGRRIQLPIKRGQTRVLKY
jgi:hypothetical protein